MTDYASKWGIISEHGKEEKDDEGLPTGMYSYPWDGKELNNTKRYRITWPKDWPSYEMREVDGMVFEINGDLKVPYVELCDKDDRPEAMGV